ncbi:hypothetical protein Bbelb_046620 [Branchiostoma belcheri]|nr:hypothetical protein Bbelb_046620 [Branchiostoma belcheri]
MASLYFRSSIKSGLVLCPVSRLTLHHSADEFSALERAVSGCGDMQLVAFMYSLWRVEDFADGFEIQHGPDPGDETISKDKGAIWPGWSVAAISYGAGHGVWREWRDFYDMCWHGGIVPTCEPASLMAEGGALFLVSWDTFKASAFRDLSGLRYPDTLSVPWWVVVSGGVGEDGRYEPV